MIAAATELGWFIANGVKQDRMKVELNQMASSRLFALGRLKAGVMNKLESEYYADLEARKADSDIAWFKFEGIKLRLADNTFYTPDFAVMRGSGIMELHEVKGFWTDDARVKIKVAADSYPFRFIAVTKKKKKDGGGWCIEEF